MLAAPDLAVSGSEVYEEYVRWVERDGVGDGGDVGGSGRIEASSSASGGLEGDQREPGASEGELESDPHVWTNDLLRQLQF